MSPLEFHNDIDGDTELQTKQQPRKPQDEIRNACSQSPLCYAEDARKVARCKGELKLLSTK